MTKAVLTLVATLAFVAGAYLVSFTGFAPDQFPVPQLDPPVQPAGYAFAIWGLIFLGLLASSLFGLFKRVNDPRWDAVRLPLMISFGIGAVWNSVANASPVWATVLIWLMLVTAAWGLIRAPQTDKPWLAWPLGLYTGWLTAASSVSIGLLAAGYGIIGAEYAGILAIGIAAALTIAGITTTGNPAFALAVIWALVALVGKNLEDFPTVAYSAGLAILVVAVSFALGPARFSRSN